MATLTIRNLPDEVHRAIRVMAVQQGRSTEAQIRWMLEAAVKPPERLRMGTALAALGQGLQLTDAEVDALVASRDRRESQPPVLE